MAVSRDRGGGVSAAWSRAGPCSAGSPLSGVSRRTWSCGHREQVRGLPRPASHTRKRSPALPWDRRAVAEGTAGLPGVGLTRPPALLPARVSTWKPSNAPGGGLPAAPQLREAPVLGRGGGGSTTCSSRHRWDQGAWCRSWLCHLGVRVLICKMGCSEGPSPWGCKDCVSGATALWPWTDTSLEHRHHLHACAPQSHVCLVTALFVGCFF